MLYVHLLGLFWPYYRLETYGYMVTERTKTFGRLLAKRMLLSLVTKNPII